MSMMPYAEGKFNQLTCIYLVKDSQPATEVNKARIFDSIVCNLK